MALLIHPPPDDAAVAGADPRSTARSSTTSACRRLSRTRRSIGTVLVAFVAIFSTVFVFGAADKAQASIADDFIKWGAKMIPAAATRAAPALLFNPAGAALFATGSIAFYALGGDEWVAEKGGTLADKIQCAIAGDNCNGDTPGGSWGQAEAEMSMPPGWTVAPYASVQWNIRVTGVNQVAVTAQCLLTPLGQLREDEVLFDGAYCGPGSPGVDNPSYSAVGASAIRSCKDDLTGEIRNFSGGLGTGYANYAPCVAGESLVSLRIDNASVNSDRVHRSNTVQGWGVNGTSQTRTDVICAKADGTEYVREGTPVGYQNWQINYCDEGDEAVGIALSTRSGPGQPWNSLGETRIGGGSTDYSECMTPAGANDCIMDVELDGQMCVYGQSRCFGWQEYPPDRLRCMWGPYSMPLPDCDPLADIYRTGAIAPYYGDPSGVAGPGQWVGVNPDGSPTPARDPAWEPAPRPSTEPGTGTNPNPGTGTRPLPPATEPSLGGGGDGASCMNAAVSWNPIDWIFVPVKCALLWAFVPSPGFVGTQLEAVSRSWGDTVVGRWMNAAGDLVTAVGTSTGTGGGGCQGPGITADYPIAGVKTIHPWNACSSPMSTVAAITKAILTVGLWLGVMFVGVRMLGASVGLDLGSWGRGGDSDV